MAELTPQRKLNVIGLYLEGYPYEHIGAESGVSKGSVSAIVADFRGGKIIPLGELRDQMGLLRETAVALRREGVSIPEAALALSSMRRVVSLGVQPGELDQFVAMCRKLARPDEGVSGEDFARAVLVVHKFMEQTGMDPIAAESKVRELKATHENLEEGIRALVPLNNEVKSVRVDLGRLEKARGALRSDIGELEGNRDSLETQINLREEREKELSIRVVSLEERAHEADQRLATARKAMASMADMGISEVELQGFGERLAGIAQRHHINTSDLRSRLLSELEKLDEGLSLESLINARRESLEQLESSGDSVRRQVARQRGVLNGLKRKEQRLEASFDALHKNSGQEIERAGAEAILGIRGTIDGLRNELNAYTSEVAELAGTPAELGAQVAAHDGVRRLLALLNERDGLEPPEAKALALTLLRALTSWLDRNPEVTPPLAKFNLDSLIREFQMWRV